MTVTTSKKKSVTAVSDIILRIKKQLKMVRLLS